MLNLEIVRGFTYFLRNDLHEDLTRVDWLSLTRTGATHVLTTGMEMVGMGTLGIGALVLLILRPFKPPGPA
jgi:hypothetical protein